MKNRRQDYRHAFAPSERLRVELTPGPREGSIVDLSVGGLGVAIADDGQSLNSNERLQARFQLGADGPELIAPVVVVHCRPGHNTHLGLRFAALADPVSAETLDRRIWSFLIGAQRHVRRRQTDLIAS